MTATINNTTATATTEGELITLTVNGQNLKLKADEVTAVTDALLAARKEAYEAARTAKQAAKDAAAKERAEKKAARAKAQAEKRAARKAKLEAELAKLSA